MMIRQFLLFWSFSSANDFYFEIISFPINGFDQQKEVSYQFGYAVQDEMGGHTIALYFHTAMVNNKKQ